MQTVSTETAQRRSERAPKRTAQSTYLGAERPFPSGQEGRCWREHRGRKLKEKEYCLVGTGLQSGMMTKLWNWTVVMAAQHGGRASCHGAARLPAKMVNFMSGICYHNKQDRERKDSRHLSVKQMARASAEGRTRAAPLRGSLWGEEHPHRAGPPALNARMAPC